MKITETDWEWDGISQVGGRKDIWPQISET